MQSTFRFPSEKHVGSCKRILRGTARPAKNSAQQSDSNVLILWASEAAGKRFKHPIKDSALRRA
jgi:hypothetical protein